MIITVFEQVLILVVFCAAGFALAKKNLANPSQTKLLSALEIYVFLPCLAFKNFAANFTVDYLSDRYIFVVISVAILLLAYPLCKIPAKMLSKKSYNRAVYHYTLMIPNFGYIGYALCQGIYGDVALMDMMMFAMPLNFYIYSFGYSSLTGGEGKISFKRIFSPSLIAMLLGCAVGVSGWQIPSLVTDIAGKGGACMAPVSMLLTGIVIAEYNFKELIAKGKTYIVVALRLLVIPVLLFGLLKAASYGFAQLGLTTVANGVTASIPFAVLAYCMPCGMNTIIYPKMVGEDCKIGASTVLVSTLAALVTVPLCVTFLK